MEKQAHFSTAGLSCDSLCMKQAPLSKSSAGVSRASAPFQKDRKESQNPQRTRSPPNRHSIRATDSSSVMGSSTSKENIGNISLEDFKRIYQSATGFPLDISSAKTGTRQVEGLAKTLGRKEEPLNDAQELRFLKMRINSLENELSSERNLSSQLSEALKKYQQVDHDLVQMSRNMNTQEGLSLTLAKENLDSKGKIALLEEELAKRNIDSDQLRKTRNELKEREEELKTQQKLCQELTSRIGGLEGALRTKEELLAEAKREKDLAVLSRDQEREKIQEQRKEWDNREKKEAEKTQNISKSLFASNQNEAELRKQVESLSIALEKTEERARKSEEEAACLKEALSSLENQKGLFENGLKEEKRVNAKLREEVEQYETICQSYSGIKREKDDLAFALERERRSVDDKAFLVEGKQRLVEGLETQIQKYELMVRSIKDDSTKAKMRLERDLKAVRMTLEETLARLRRKEMEADQNGQLVSRLREEKSIWSFDLERLRTQTKQMEADLVKIQKEASDKKETLALYEKAKGEKRFLEQRVSGLEKISLELEVDLRLSRDKAENLRVLQAKTAEELEEIKKRLSENLSMFRSEKLDLQGQIAQLERSFLAANDSLKKETREKSEIIEEKQKITAKLNEVLRQLDEAFSQVKELRVIESKNSYFEEIVQNLNQDLAQERSKPQLLTKITSKTHFKFNGASRDRKRERKPIDGGP